MVRKFKFFKFRPNLKMYLGEGERYFPSLRFILVFRKIKYTTG